MNADIEKSFEGCRLTAYLDSVGVPTIGYGHTRGVSMGDTCSQDQADEWLIDDLHDALASVQGNVTVPLTDPQLSALVDFVFNVGGKNFAHSTMLRLLNAGQYEQAENEFKKWNLAGGHVLAGLVRRRAAEAALFDSGIA